MAVVTWALRPLIFQGLLVPEATGVTSLLVCCALRGGGLGAPAVSDGNYIPQVQ